MVMNCPQSSPGRVNFHANTETTRGPGHYEKHRQFGANMSNFQMGKKKEIEIEKSVGPGCYSPSHTLTKPKSRGHTIRPKSSNQNHKMPLEEEMAPGPGTYNLPLDDFGKGA